VQAFLNDRFLVEKGLTNYWGYQTLGFFAPDPRYLHAGQIAEFQHMVARLHAAGIEVILDVVYNHTARAERAGPDAEFRGLDNLSYYRLAPDKRGYINDTGTGNTVNVDDHPMVLRMVLDSPALLGRGDACGRVPLRSVLDAGRTEQGSTAAPLFQAIRQDPVLTPSS
jgi:isoamylase